jgi:membrane-associated phospholipid phosphatase
MLLKDMKLQILIITLIFLITPMLNAQDFKQDRGSVYSVNRGVEVSVTAALFISNFVGFKYLDRKSGLTATEINALNANDIWKFDRVATQQDADTRDQYATASDYVMNAMLILPALLVIDKDIRRDWLDLLILYGETQAMNTSLYLLSASSFDRGRPFLYHPDVSYEEKSALGTTTSFYSGHTSTTAAASFFMAKVYSDYHPELGNKKYWVFSAALIPPIVVGALRVKAMKHFPTDIIAGTVLGAAIGILVPQLHKKKKNKDLSFIPYTGAVNGLLINYKIR